MSSPRLRRPIAVASTAILASMLLGPGTALAAIPTVEVGSTSPTTETSAAVPKLVSIGDTAWFQTTIQNTDTSTISQLFLGVFSDATLYSYGVPVTYAVTLTKNDATVNGACGPGTNGAQVSCSVRNVKPLDEVQATFVLKIPLTLADGVTKYAGSTDSLGALRSCPVGSTTGYANDTTGLPVIPKPATCVLSMWSSNGAPSSDGGTSHGDTFNFNDGVAINTDLQEFRSRYVHETGQSIVENDQNIGSTNPHSTRAYAPTTGIPVTVEDIDCSTSTNSLCAALTTGFGQVSRVDVNGGFDISGTAGTTLLHFMIKLGSSEIPSGTNANNLGVYHVYDDGTGTLKPPETITARCTFSTKTSPTPNNAPCITVTKLKNIGLQVDVWNFHNGGVRAF